MPMFKYFDFDVSEAGETEARSPEAAAEYIASLADDGGCDSADIGVRDDHGEWRRYKVHYERTTRITAGNGKPCDDPTAEEE